MIDAFLLSTAIYMAFVFQFENFWPAELLVKRLPLLFLLLPLKLSVFYFMRMYQSVLRYTGLAFLYTTLKAIILSSSLLAICTFLLQITTLPRSVFFIDGILSFLLIIGVRLLMRWLIYDINLPFQMKLDAKKVIIYGAGEAGIQLVNSLSQDYRYQTLAFVDDNSAVQGQIVNGFWVYSPEKLHRLIRLYRPHLILLAMPSISRQRKQVIIKQLQHFSIPIKSLPDIGEIVAGTITVNEIRNIDITELLGREEIAPIEELLAINISDKTVLITGAGGSIGSELCRQIAQQHPKCLILLEQSEFALYTIDSELTETFPELQQITYLGSVTDFSYLRKILNQHRVETIYHAAAYKHVPLLERNPANGVLNNVLGTLIATRTALDCHVETFVLISTDKAVRPFNVMGATKRVAELILQALAKENEKRTRFVIVRFGNVLNSTGSVIPLFREQIAAGKTLTVTHPEVTRYFMSISEASRLVIQAGALGKGGEVFLLEMGKPIKIYDLAIQMIELSGLIPEKDIGIKFIGLRPGEKMYEELLFDRKNTTSTMHPKIYKAQENFIPFKTLQPLLDSLLEASRNDASSLKSLLKTIVPEYHLDVEPSSFRISSADEG
ncbi:MAG: polysaccharide biosynthesis protein [SAR324 cluster bacterium]|nr:polysaccharide biosynthesis protein [SAR324 cluster bacterium]